MTTETTGKQPSLDEKLAVVAALRASRNAAQDAEIQLRLSGQAEAADRVWESAQRLNAEIDILIGRLLGDWHDATPVHAATLAAAQGELAQALAQLRQQQTVVVQTAKFCSLLDSVARLAVRFSV